MDEKGLEIDGYTQFALTRMYIEAGMKGCLSTNNLTSYFKRMKETSRRWRSSDAHLTQGHIIFSFPFVLSMII
jgi:hypothetical protein